MQYKKKRFDIVEYLIEINAPTDENTLEYCSYSLNWDILKKLADNGALVTDTAIKSLAWKCQLDLVKYLLLQNTSIKTKELITIQKKIFKEVNEIIFEFIGSDISSIILSNLLNYECDIT